MRTRSWVRLPIELTAWLAWGLMAAAAAALAPFRLGRLVRLVTLPRLRKHRLRSTLTVFGVALGVAMLVAVSLVNDSVLRTVNATVGELAGTTDLQISAGSSGFAEALIAQVQSVPGVARAVPIVQQTVTVRDARGRGERLLLLGVDMLGPDDGQFRRYASAELESIRSDPFEFLNNTHALLLSRNFAERLGYEPQASITLATSRGPEAFKSWGTLDGHGLGSAFGGAVAVMYYQAMQSVFDRGENIDRIDVLLSPAADGVKVTRALRGVLGDGFVIEAPAQKGERVGNMLAGVQSGLTIASLIALVVGAFLVHNTLTISVVQRRRELGILRALGAQKREVIALMTLEGAVMGFAGSCAGVGAGVLLARLLLRLTSFALSQTYLEVGAADVALRWQVLVAGGLLGVVAAILASVLPARRAADTEPAEVLRAAGTVDVRRAAPLGARDVCGAALAVAPWAMLTLPPVWGLPIGAFGAAASLLAAGTLLVPRLVQWGQRLLAIPARRWFSVEARLANSNLPRDLGRTSITASALMSGVALTVGFGAFTHSFAISLSQWVDQTLPGDLFITRGARMASTTNTPMNDTLYERLRALPEVDGVRRVRIAELPFRGYTTKVVSSDIDVFRTRSRLQLLEGTDDVVAPALHAGALIVSENFARHFHVHRGDTVELSTQLGTRGFAVAGVFVDYTSDVGTLLLERAHYVQAFRDARVDTYELYLRDPSASERVRRELSTKLADADDYYILTSGEFRGSIRQTTDGLFGLVRALELVALIVAVLGILNAQFANVLDRRRELAVLRAVGMLPMQLRRMVVIEAALVGVVGTFAGIALGFAFGYLLLDHVNLVQTGWYFPYHIPTRSIIEVTCLTLPAAALAGVYPAYAATRAPISEALENA